jgi:PHD/YefM family antitoxin component YafN of YafNO toxin-antitoxin module|tara:strand:- start:1484 stop:1774 length:291 start_codon:yes stop_codon:yes gene_type:complete
MAIINKKEFTILIRLRQIEKYLQDKIKYFGKNSQDFKLLIVVKNTIQLLKELDDNATGVVIPAEDFEDLKDEDLVNINFIEHFLQRRFKDDDDSNW